MQIKDLKKDKRNYRKHNQRNLDLIKKSVDEVGFGRSIVIDNKNEIIAGNGLVSSISKDTKLKIIETDGSELVVVKRTDLDTDDSKRKQLAIMDNSTSDSSEFDIELLSTDFDIDILDDFGVEINIDSDEYNDTELKEEQYIERFEIIVECQNEEEQENYYNMFIKKGIKCRIQSL